MVDWPSFFLGGAVFTVPILIYAGKLIRKAQISVKEALDAVELSNQTMVDFRNTTNNVLRMHGLERYIQD